MPYVSVVIPAYNAADFIIDAYGSIVAQTMDDWEAIFVDDGSQDDTLSILQTFAAADRRIKVLSLTVNSGAACARNAALAVAEGDWIALLDADDRYSRDRLEVLTRAAERVGADIVLDNQFIVDPISGRVAFLAFEPDEQEQRPLEFSDFLRNAQSGTVFDFGYLQPIIRRRWLLSHHIRYADQLRRRQDLMLMFECYARQPKVILLSKPYYHYYFRFNQLSPTKPAATNTVLREPLLDEMERYLERYHAKLSPLERRLFASTCESLREDMMFAALRAYLKHLDVLGAVGTLRHPVRLFRGIYFAKKRSFLYRRRLKTSLERQSEALDCQVS
jgi:succinoglycan biosynthesis protein ExoO